MLTRLLLVIVVVPYRGKVGRKRCEQAGVQRLDLSGNAHIVAPGVRTLIEGQPKRFTPAADRLLPLRRKHLGPLEWLLIQPDTFLTQRDIALATDVDEGYTSWVVGRLKEENLVIRDQTGAEKVTIDFLIQPSQPDDVGGKLRDVEQDFAAVIAPGLHLAYRDRTHITLSGKTHQG